MNDFWQLRSECQRMRQRITEITFQNEDPRMVTFLTEAMVKLAEVEAVILHAHIFSMKGGSR